MRCTETRPRPGLYALAVSETELERQLKVAKFWETIAETLSKLGKVDLAMVDESEAISRDPSERPQSAGAFARELHAALVALAPIPKPDGARWVANTVIPSRGATVHAAFQDPFFVGNDALVVRSQK